MNIPGQHFFQTFGGQGFDPGGCVVAQVMPVPKGHGYVFAVEAKHCRGVRAPKFTNLERSRNSEESHVDMKHISW